MIKSLKYNFYLLLHSRASWLLFIGLLLFTGVNTVFTIVDTNSFFMEMRDQGIYVKEIAIPLGDLLTRVVPTAALFFVIITVVFVAGKYVNRTVVHWITSSNNRAQLFFSEILTVALLSLVISMALIGVAAGCYFATCAVYGQGVPADVLTLKPPTQVFLYMFFTGLFIVGITEIIRNVVAGMAVGVLWSIGLIEMMFKLSILGRVVVYYPFNLLSELLGNSVYSLGGGSTPFFLPTGEAILWSSVWSVVFLVVAFALSVKRDAVR